LGKKILLNSTEDSPISDIKWLPNSKYVLYEQDYNINLIDYEGDNQNMLLSKNQLIHKSIDENNTEDPAENEESRLENTDSDPSINDEEADINDIINKYFITNFSSDKSYHIEVTDQNISIMEYEIN